LGLLFVLVIWGAAPPERRAEARPASRRETRRKGTSTRKKSAQKAKRRKKKNKKKSFRPPAGFRRVVSLRAIHGKTVRSLRFRGLSRTRRLRLLHHMDTEVGEKIDWGVLAEDLRRLRNLELFTTLVLYVRPRGDDAVDLLLHLEDKWSLLPYFNFVRGGGSYQIVCGVYDVNVLGAMFMLDANFIVFDGQPAGILYGRVPRVAGLPLELGADGGISRAIRTTYWMRTLPWQTFSLDSRWINLLAETEPVPWLRLMLWQKFLWRKVSFAKETAYAVHLPPGGRRAETGVMLSLGKVTYQNYLMHGLKLTLWGTGSFEALGSDTHFLRISWDARGYYRFGPRGGNLAGRLHGGYMTGGTLFDEFALGSFSGLRGFQYAQFVGRAFVAGSLEYRTGLLPLRFPIVSKIHRVFRGKTLRLQGVVFTEMGSIVGSRHFSTPESGQMLLSVGAGFRGIFVPFYKAVLRVDACYTLEPFRAFDLMIATQQAF
jgi:hypothetical protein